MPAPPALHRLIVAAAAAGLLVGVVAVPTVAACPRVPVPAEAAIRAAGGRLVAIERVGGRTTFHAVKASRGREAATARALAAAPDVDAVVVDRAVSVAAWPDDGPPDDPAFATSQGGFGLIDVAGAWPATRGAGATVAVLDTGADLAHPDLAGLRIEGTWNALDGSTNVADGHGHGTHVLGTLAATANNGIGVAGVAPDVGVLVVKVLGDDGVGTFSAVANGMEWAIAHGADVISMSLGATGTADMYSGFAVAAEDAWRAGVVVTAAAGNTGDARLHFPACWDHVIAVASVGPTTARSSFSTANACTDVAAPGEGILSTFRGGGYVRMSGTSMATPHVAGVAALVRSAAPGAGPDTVETILEGTALDLGPEGRDPGYGDGLVQAGASLAVATGRAPMPVPGNVAPEVAAFGVDHARIATNPLGTGTVPAGLGFTARVRAVAEDPDGVASATLVLRGAGLAVPVYVSMAPDAGAWATTVDTRLIAIPGGTLSTSVLVRDALGKAITRPGPSLTVVRADTRGTAAVTRVERPAPRRVKVTVAASDADATFAGSATTLTARVRWRATWLDAAGRPRATSWRVTSAAYRGGHRWSVVLPSRWWTAGLRRVRITAIPLAIDPYRGVTTGGAVTRQLTRR